MIQSIIKLIEFLLNKVERDFDLSFDASKKTGEKTIRKLISFIYGLFVGLIIYHSIIRYIGFSGKRQGLIISISCAVCALFCTLSIQFRCISVLMWFEAMGKAGRNLLKTIIIALILAGPIANIIQNTMEVTRVFECTTTLTYNLMRNKFDLAIMPFINAFTHMESNLSAVQDSLNEISYVIAPIVQEIEGHDNATRR